MKQVSNEEFLRENFAGLDSSRFAVWVASFPGNPKAKDEGRWSGFEFNLEHPTALVPANNNYFSIAALNRDGKGPWRDNDHFGALCTVMLDDIGTKVDEDRIVLEPTWRLETSPNNFQVGYRLREAFTDAKLARRLIGGLIDAGFSDPGADGVVRYARLPQGSNGRVDPHFSCTLHDFDPERTYPVAQIAEAFNIQLHGRLGRPPNDDATPLNPETDPIVKALHRLGLLTGRASNKGWLHMTCPWRESHTGGVDTAASYLPGLAFKCFHGHCADRTLRDLLEWLGQNGEDIRQLIVALPPKHGAMIRGTQDYIYSADIERFVHVDTGAMLTKEQLNDYHANLVAAPFSKLLLRRDDFRRTMRSTYRPNAPLLHEQQIGPVPENVVNLWREGPVGRSLTVDMIRIEPWLAHLRWLFPEEKDWTLVLDFLTYLIAHRGRKINWALILVAAQQGTGRDTLIFPVVSILGAFNVQAIDGARLDSDFNGYLVSELVYLSELDTSEATARKIYSKLKSMVVCPPEYHDINEKNIRQRQYPKVANFIILSNNRRALTIDPDDRRFAVVETKRTKAETVERHEDGAYKKLHAMYNEDGWLENFHAYLMNRDVSKTFDAKGRAPDSVAKAMLAARTDPAGKALLREWINAQRKPLFDIDLFQFADVMDELKLALPDEMLIDRNVAYWLDDLQCDKMGQSVHGDFKSILWACRDAEQYAAMRSEDRAMKYLEQRKAAGRPWRF